MSDLIHIEPRTRGLDGGLSRCKHVILAIMIVQVPLWCLIYTKAEASVARNSWARSRTPGFSATDAGFLQPALGRRRKCPKTPPGLVGRRAVTFRKPPPTLEEIRTTNHRVKAGGRFSPPGCKSRHKVAIIIPYRDRPQHLRHFLHYMHPILQRQQLDYRVYLINQMRNTTFNCAKLMNIGHVEALKDDRFRCFVFHDVDLILEDDRALYACPTMPRHLTVAVDKFDYALPSRNLFGGVTNLRREHLAKVNGHSNRFWGWGGEDDDMSIRIRRAGLSILRYSADISRYKMIPHERDRGNEANGNRHPQLRLTKWTWSKDGINSLEYDVIGRVDEPLFTNITVDPLQLASHVTS